MIFVKLELYQTVRLATGQRATIVEILGNGEAYLADVVLLEADYKADPPVYAEFETETIYPKDITSVFESVEKPFANV